MDFSILLGCVVSMIRSIHYKYKLMKAESKKKEGRNGHNASKLGSLFEVD
jgi:hypothetical protein